MNAKGNTHLSRKLKTLRKKARLSQKDLAKFSGIGLPLIRKIEQNGTTMRVDKVNQILSLFGYHLEAVPDEQSEPVPG